MVKKQDKPVSRNITGMDSTRVLGRNMDMLPATISLMRTILDVGCPKIDDVIFLKHSVCGN